MRVGEMKKKNYSLNYFRNYMLIVNVIKMNIYMDIIC